MRQAKTYMAQADQGGTPDLLSVMFVRVCGLACGAVAAFVVYLADASAPISVLAFLAAFVAVCWLAGRLFNVPRWWAWPFPAASSRAADSEHSDEDSGSP